MTTNDDILADTERMAFWLLDAGIGTRATTLEGLLEEFALNGGLEAFGISEDTWKSAYDKQWAATPVCQDCGMRHQPDDHAACIEGHGDDAELGEASAAQKLEWGPR